MSNPPDVNLWTSPEHALDYLRRADSIPHRVEGEATLLEFLPPGCRRILDLGSGGGRLLALTRAAHPKAEFTALDFSPTMLAALRETFGGQTGISIIAHDLECSLPVVGKFDAVISSFAIHHLPHARKRALYQEIFGIIEPGGAVLNLEHVASPTLRLHEEFLRIIWSGPEDPSNKLLDVQTQLVWLREIGFDEVDCHWKWRELALFGGRRPH